jgi:hypothetical protein
MSELIDTLDRPRRRHRSGRRKLVDSLLLAVGAPCLIFAVLALSVELIEYEPAPDDANALGSVVATTSAPIRPITTRPIVVPQARSGMLAPLDAGVDAGHGEGLEVPLEPQPVSGGMLPID